MTDNSQSLKPLLDLMQCRKLKEVKKLANKIEISSDGFFKLILLAQAEKLDIFPYLHQIHCREHQPEHLHLTDKDLKGIANNGVGKLEGDAIKAMSKVNQMFKERKWTVGHMFYTQTLNSGIFSILISKIWQLKITIGNLAGATYIIFRT